MMSRTLYKQWKLHFLPSIDLRFRDSNTLCSQKKIFNVHAYPDETDSRLFKLLRYLNVPTVIHKWCVLEHYRINAIQTKCYKKKTITEPVAAPLDSWPERCTMTMKRKISPRASITAHQSIIINQSSSSPHPILRLGPLLLSDTCNPQQAVRERKVGP